VAKQGSVTAVLLDFDGTLVDLPTDYDEVRRRLAVLFAAQGVHLTFQPLLESLRRAEAALSSAGRSDGDVQNIMQRALDTITGLELEAVSRSALQEGVIDFLSAVRERGYRTAIVTNNSRTAVLKAFRRWNLPPPDTIVGREDVSEHKPNPAPAVLALQRLGVRAKEAILVGNNDRDLRMGRAAGIRTVLVSIRPGPGNVAKISDLLSII